MEIRMRTVLLNILLLIVPTIIQGQEIWNGNFIHSKVIEYLLKL